MTARPASNLDAILRDFREGADNDFLLLSALLFLDIQLLI
jgi:hypothetical protein